MIELHFDPETSVYVPEPHILGEPIKLPACQSSLVVVTPHCHPSLICPSPYPTVINIHFRYVRAHPH